MKSCANHEEQSGNQIGQTNQGDNDESFSETVLPINRDGSFSNRKYDRPEDREHKPA